MVHASEYLKQFPSPVLSIVAKFISFVSGGFAVIIIAFLEESLLEGHVMHSIQDHFVFFRSIFTLRSYIKVFLMVISDFWSQFILVCCCVWNHNSHKPGCSIR